MGSSKPHYFAIGLFVLIATTLALAGIVAFSSDAMRSPKHFIETYVDESVQGIDIGTPFKFRGVKVGNVSDIAMVSSRYETSRMYVMIRVALDDRKLSDNEWQQQVQVMIDEGLRLKLVPQGITGLSFVEAEFYPDAGTDPLEIDWKPDYTYVPSTPAMMTLLSRSIERITAEINTLNLAAIGSNVEGITSNLNLSVQHIEKMTRNAAGASDDVVSNIQLASEGLPTVVSNLNNTVVLLEEMLGDSDRDIEQVLVNLRYITDDTRELIRMIKRYPGMLLTEPPEELMNREEKRK